MLTIIVMLLNRPRISAKELADKFEVSIRTVYRDIDAINQAGIPVISYQGNNGGFGIMENYKLSHQLLTFENLSSILSALKGFNSSFGDSGLDSSIEKLRNLVPKDKVDELSQHMQQIIITKQPWTESTKYKERISLLRQAIESTHMVHIDYKNYVGEISSRQVEPISLVFKGYTWYLFAYCRLKNDFRLFRLSRIQDMSVENRRFEHRNVEYDDLYNQETQKLQKSEITLKFNPKIKTKVGDIFDQDQIEELETGELLVRADFTESDWYYSLILSFGEWVEVISPTEVRTEVKRRIVEMAEKYK